jgi:hypothetical protein
MVRLEERIEGYKREDMGKFMSVSKRVRERKWGR